MRGHAPYEAVRGRDGAVAGLMVAPVTADGALDTSALRRIDCDAILMSVGWAAAAQLLIQAGGGTRFSEELQQFIPAELPPGLFAAGRMNGVYDLESRLADGRRAGSQAAAHAGFGAPSAAVVARSTRCPSHRFPIFDHPDGKNFVDFDEDLQVKDLENAAQEGFDSSELLKRYSTVGMGPSQGKHSNMNALRILARRRGVGVEQLGLTTARPMYHPVPMKLLAGRSFYPERRSPMRRATWGVGRGLDAGGQLATTRILCGVRREPRTEHRSRGARGAQRRRAHRCGDARENRDLRTGFGRVSGSGVRRAVLRFESRHDALWADAGRVRASSSTTASSRAWARSCYYFTTTTGGSATVFRELLRLNALWGLDCSLVNVTGHCAAFNFAGPSSREISAAVDGCRPAG